jgi:hypothetical protein
MSALFTHAMRYEWLDRNPIKLVRQSAKRERIPDVLELTELQLLLSKLGIGNGPWLCLTRHGASRQRTSGPALADVDFETLN